jgi:Spy/CpxP family protein refolding chaperone
MNARTTLAAVAILTSTLSSAAEPSHPQPGPDMERLGILLDLNDYQKGEMQKILEAQHEQMMAKHEQLRSTGTRPSREEMQKQREQFRQDTTTKLQAVLTPEQIKKFEALNELRPPGPRMGGPGRPHDASAHPTN